MVMAYLQRCASLFVIVFTGACVSDFDERPSQVESVRVIAVRSIPAEAPPGASVNYEALVVGPDGRLDISTADWAFCTRPSSAKELNEASIACFRRAADWIVPLGMGAMASGTLPTNACGQFGPDGSQTKPGEPMGRPADPDSTGGYHQPVRLLIEQEKGHVLALGSTRLSCGLPGATQDVLQAFKAGYRANENPRLSAVDVLGVTVSALTPDDGVTTPRKVRRGERLVLRASWPECPVTAECGDAICSPGEDVTSCAEDCSLPRGCPGAEPYVSFDLVTRTLVERREAMRISWLATAGSFDSDHTGRAENEADALDSENAWTAPNRPGPVHLWVALRDSRGGVDWGSYLVEVE